MYLSLLIQLFNNDSSDTSKRVSVTHLADETVRRRSIKPNSTVKIDRKQTGI
jgi:hypothetical protein